MIKNYHSRQFRIPRMRMFNGFGQRKVRKGKGTRMLTVINRYSHGYIAIPVIISCKQHGLFERLKEMPASAETLRTELSANSGHLQVGLKLLESMGWLSKDGAGVYQLAKGAQYCSKIPDNVTALFEFSVDDYLNDAKGVSSLRPWIDLSMQSWDVDDESLAGFLDGVLLIPILLGIHRHGLFVSESGELLLERISPKARGEIVDLFLHKEWCEKENSEVQLTEIGKFVLSRSLNTGTVASYTQMLLNMDELIFGDAARVFSIDEDGHEGHVERTLNVVSSGFQHDRYFKEVEELILSIFSQMPFNDQPRYVADIGCGDGTFLKRIYKTVVEHTERGKVLDEYPLTMIGVDYNEKALAATAKNLHGIDHFVLKGDIGDPEQMERDLRARFENIEDILYIRSFLDHDRPFKYPDNQDQIKQRKLRNYEAVCVDRQGALIDPAVAVQSLVEHLRRWASVHSRFGIIILEAHCLGAATVRQYMNESENLHFDAYHAFSRQCLNEASVFVMSAAEAGLIPEFDFSKKFPKTLPFARITINYFRKRAYSIRHATCRDAHALAALEAKVLPPDHRSTEIEIQERINAYPEGQAVLTVGEDIIGAVYSQRTASAHAGKEASENFVWAHHSDAPHFELLYAVVSEKENKGSGEELISFMRGYAFLESGVEDVTGVRRCIGYLDYGMESESSASDFSINIRKYVDNYQISQEEDTVHAEYELEAFGARWLLRIFQQMGVFIVRGERYASSNALIERLEIQPKYHRLFDSLLGILERQGLLVHESNAIVTLDAVESFALRDVESERIAFERAYRSQYPSFTAFLDLMVRCLKSYREVLVGELDATDVVFPGGSMDLFAGIFRGNSVADYFNNLVSEVVYNRLLQERLLNPGRHIKILEIGAGTGGATDFVLKRIKRISDNVTLYYTDISSSFTRYGQRRYVKAYPWIKFERLNIEGDPIAQGFDENSFDIIYASNVLHDTKYLDHTLVQVKKLLRDPGLLVLNEFTVMKDLLLYTGGLLHGWWLFEDPENRLKNSCLLSVEKWRTILEKCGFNHFEAYGLPFQTSLDECRQGVLFCESPEPHTECQAETEVIDGPHGEARLIVQECMESIIGNKRMVRFTPDMPLMELGFDSLELLELRELLGKRLGVKLGAPFLFQHNTVDKIAVYIQESLPRQRTEQVLENPDMRPVPHNAEVLGIVEYSMRAIGGSRRMVKYSPDMPLMELGFDSLELLELRELLGKQLGVKLGAPFLFQYNTASKITRYILDNALEISKCKAADGAEPLVTVSEEKNENGGFPPPATNHQYREEDIAIVGVSLRFPGDISTMDDYWELLRDARSAICRMPKERWNWPADLDLEDEKAYLLKGGFFNRIDEFDAPFFRVSPKEAELMDPQQRMLLELSWEVMEDAGYKPTGLQGSETGVYVGACHFEYRKLLEEHGISRDAYFSTGTSGSILANRLSYFYDFRGPSVMLDTACSSSLMAVHEAVQGIRRGACDQALVGGVNLICSSVNVLSYDEAGMLSKDGTCYAFDERANGYVRGEGGGMLFLKSAQAAIRDKDPIYAIVKGSAVNHGGQASSLTAPNPQLQAQLIIKALQDGGVPGDSIGYVEAHGTGTSLGDPIEAEGLKQAFCGDSGEASDKRNIALGSVKSNLGHLEGAAGMAGLIKVALSLRHKIIPQTTNYRRLNPEIDLAPIFSISDQARSWMSIHDAQGNSIPRRAGVSAFGFGGANAHVILEEFPDVAAVPRLQETNVFVLSAKNKQQLRDYVMRFSAYLSQAVEKQNFSVTNMCYTLQVAREEMKERLAIVFSDLENLQDALRQVSAGYSAIPGVFQTAGFSSTPGEPLARDNTEKPQIEAMLRNKELDKLAELWVNCHEVSWRSLYGEAVPMRINLPKYPFARERYWIPGTDAETDLNNGLDRIPAIHPLVHRNRSDFSGQWFYSTFTGREFFLKDHVIDGRLLLPGVAYLEMAREAVNNAVGVSGSNGEGICLADIAWSQPIVVGERPVSVRIDLLPDDSGDIFYEIYSESSDKEEGDTMHGQGRAVLRPVLEAPALNLSMLKSQCKAFRLDADEYYQAFKVMGIDYGPGNKGIEAVYVGEGLALAKLSLPASVRERSGQFIMHPSMLDSALQATFAFAIGSGDLQPLLPFALDEVEIHRPCKLDMWAVVTRVDTGTPADRIQKFDIDLCDELGNLSIRMKGYAPRPSDEGACPTNERSPIASNSIDSRQTEMLMLTPVWDDMAVEQGAEFPGTDDRVWIVGGAPADWEPILARHPHARILDVGPEDTIDVIAEKIETLGVVEHIIWIAPNDDLIRLDEEILIEDQRRGVILGFRLVKALLGLEYDARDLGWTVITVQAQPIHKDEKVNPTHVSIHGFIGSMAKEYLNWNIRLVDVEKGRAWPLDEIFRIPADSEGQAWVYRHKQWHRQQLISMQIPQVNGDWYRTGGVYVVIGGAGGIGEAWSESMIRGHQAQIVWIGRRAEDDSIREKLDALGKLGPRPLYLSADATNLSALKEAYQAIKRRYSHIHGVIHSALVLLDQSLMNMDEERFQKGLAAKVDISVRLVQVFGKEALDFVMFFSSITAFTKVVGQSNYASGCVFKDIFGHQLGREWPCSVKVINWGYWGSVGIVATPGYRERMAKSGIGSIEPDEAMQGLDKLLSGGINQAALLKSIKVA
ncbi:MAG: SDR family NAD(P)-dependent oxidoreductase [Candidatus Thiodiazotropha sp. (ex Dulcina madagascariensis)]|nr:SDR family NAD(P)-dependent oxidoreductase [Candidatus Thiodiazotropha sp. (ex Dulcina madagascariensis)]